MLSKFTNLYFPVCSLAVTILLLILFFSKKNVGNKETRIYSKLIIVGFAEAFIYSFICLIAHFIDIDTNLLLYEILNKVIYTIYIIWFSILYNYEISISFGENEIKTANIFMKVLYAIEALFVVAIIVFPVKIFFDPVVGQSNSYGMSANALFAGIGLYIFSIFCVAVAKFENSSNNNIIKLYTNNNGTYSEINSYLNARPNEGWINTIDTDFNYVWVNVYKDSNNKYRFRKGWYQDDNSDWYYLQEQSNQNISAGVMLTNWQYLSFDGTTEWYYFYPLDTEGHTDGSMAKGWLSYNGSWYYLRPTAEGNHPKGSMVTGSYTINGTTYYFNSSGACTSGC